MVHRQEDGLAARYTLGSQLRADGLGWSLIPVPSWEAPARHSSRSMRPGSSRFDSGLPPALTFGGAVNQKDRCRFCGVQILERGAQAKQFNMHTCHACACVHRALKPGHALLDVLLREYPNHWAVNK